MNENEIFRLKGRIAISNLSREDKDMINSILDGINKKDEDEKGYLYTVRVCSWGSYGRIGKRGLQCRCYGCHILQRETV